MPTLAKERLAEIEQEIARLKHEIVEHGRAPRLVGDRDQAVRDRARRLEARQLVLDLKRRALSRIGLS